MVKEQWDTINKLYEVYLEPIIGPLIGESSDGDSRRRKLFIEHMTSESNLKFQPIAKDLGFILTAEKIIGENGYRIRNLSDSDFIHNHKKLINHLDHNSRSLRMGPYLVHLNHIRNVFNIFDFHQHGVTREDINRADKQNWRSAQRLTFPKVRDCLDMVMEGENGVHQDTSVLGTKIYLLLIWMYVEIFCSKIATLERRIVYASTICRFLGIWHNWVTLEKSLTTKANFLSRETYLDILISCHFAVSVICYMRDEYPDIKCNLDETGTDCVESFWSTNGQWVGNHHNYTFGDLKRNVCHQIRLEEIRVDPNGPKFCKSHPKGESIWDSQDTTDASADTSTYPEKGVETAAWREGITKGEELAKLVGILPSNEDAEQSDWFYKPFAYSKNKIGPRICQSENEAVAEAMSEVAQPNEVYAPLLEEMQNLEILSAEQRSSSTKASATVKITGYDKDIYKATLVSLLNQDPKLSHDRLSRVRQRSEFNRAQTTTQSSTTNSLSLFDDFAFTVDGGESVIVGRVERIVLHGSHGKKDYFQPVELDSEKRENIEVTISKYAMVQSGDGEFFFKLHNTELTAIKLKYALVQVNLVASADGKLHMDDDQRKMLRTLMENIKEASSRGKRKRNATKEVEIQISSESTTRLHVDGTISTIIQPNEVDEGVRRSVRRRTVIIRDNL